MFVPSVGFDDEIVLMMLDVINFKLDNLKKFENFMLIIKIILKNYGDDFKKDFSNRMIIAIGMMDKQQLKNKYAKILLQCCK